MISSTFVVFHNHLFFSESIFFGSEQWKCGKEKGTEMWCSELSFTHW